MGFDITKKIAFAMSLSGDDKVKQAVSAVTDGLYDSEKASSLLAKGLAAVVGVVSIASLTSMVKGFIDGSAAMHDMSIQTGLSVAALQQFRSIGSYTETSIDAVATASLKLSKNLAAAGDEGKGVGKAISALGLDFDKFKKLNPDEQMLDVAKAMAKFEDGSGKSAAAMMIFGKEGAKLLPFLADLADSADQVTAKLSDQEKALAKTRAAMADAFGDNLTAISKNSEGWKKELAGGLMPALYEVSEVLREMFGGTSTLTKEMKRLAADGTLADWARGAVTAFSYLVDVVQGLFTLIPMLGNVIAGVAAGASTMFGAIFEAFNQIKSGNFSGAWESLKSGFQGVKVVASETATNISDLWGQKLLGQTFRDRLADLNGMVPAGKNARGALDIKPVLDGNAAGAKAQKDEYEALKNKIADLLLKQEAEIAQSTKLTESDKLLVQAKRQLEGAELATVTAMLAVAKEREAQIEQDGRARKATEEAVKAREQALKALDGESTKLQEQIDVQRAANETLLTGIDRTRELEIARLRDAAASAERKALIALERNEDEAQYEAFMRNAAQLRELANAKEAGIGAAAAKQARDDWTKVSDQIGQGLTDSLFRAFESGKGFFSTLWQGIKNTFKTTILKLGIDAVMNPVKSLFSAMVGGAPMAASAGQAFGGDSWLSAGLNFLSSGSTNLVNQVAAWTGLGSAAGMGIGSSIVGGTVMTPAAIEAMIGTAGYGVSAAAGAAAAGTAAGATGGAAAAAGSTGILGAIGAAAPYLAAAYMIYQAFKHKPTHHEGSVVFADAAGARTDPTRDVLGVLQHQNSGTDSALRTMLGSAAGTLNTLSSAFGGTGGFGLHGQFAADNDDASFGILDILRNGSRIGGIEKTQGGNRKDYASDPSQGFAEFGADVGRAVRSAIDTIDLPQWASDMLAELGSSPGLDQLTAVANEIAVTRRGLTDLGSALEPMGGVFTRLAGLSDEAKIKLAGMVGGIEALVAKSRSFVEAYYTQEEQLAIGARGILEQVQKAGVTPEIYSAITGLGSRDQFRALFEGVDPTNDFGLKMAGLGLNIAQPFAGIGDYLKEQGLTLGELAAKAIEPAVLRMLREAETAAGTADSAAADTDTAATTTAEAATSTASSSAATAAAVAESASILAEIREGIKADTMANAAGLLAIQTMLQQIEQRVGAIEGEMRLATAEPAGHGAA